MDPLPAFEWHDHHFINGIACLDFANTVVYRPFPARREDRLGTPADLNSWLAAAEIGKGGAVGLTGAIALREAIDSLFRDIALGEPSRPDGWGEFVAHYARLSRHHSVTPNAEGLALVGGSSDPLLAIAHSALTLALSPLCARVKVCGGCGWLFLDRTRNARKKWCISSMCGSRDKARRYYARKAKRGAARETA